MTSKEQKHQEPRTPSKQKVPKPATEKLDVVIQQQIHPAALIQRAKLDPPSLTASNMLQLQKMIGNQAVGQLLAQTAQRKPIQKEASTDLESVINGIKGRGQPLDAGLQRSMGQALIAHELPPVVLQKRNDVKAGNGWKKSDNDMARGVEEARWNKAGGNGNVEVAMVQRCKGKDDGSTVSSFDEKIRLDKDTENGKVGDGGALTVYLTGSSWFSHREVCLEWYDGYQKTGTHLAVHLATPNLAESEGRFQKQLGSFFTTTEDEGKMESVVQQFGPDWDPNYRATKNGGAKTVRLTEDEKEAKRKLLMGEIGKKYTYDIMNFGILGSKSMNCKDWATKVAPEAVI